MRNKILIAVALSLFSCEKVINIDLRDSEPVVVIEGNIPYDSLCSVLITKSMSFSQTNDFPVISGAAVTISDDRGRIETCSEITPGFYRSRTIRGREKRTYTLAVKCEGLSYSGVSSMPERVLIDSLGMSEIKTLGGGFHQVTPYFTDPGGVANFYKIEIAVNGVRDGGIHVRDDRYIDGLVNTAPINIFDAHSGDTVKVTMLCIDEPTYIFYNTLKNTDSPVSPANPVSNLTGGCQGYFKAYTTHSMERIIR